MCGTSAGDHRETEGNPRGRGSICHAPGAAPGPAEVPRQPPMPISRARHPAVTQRPGTMFRLAWTRLASPRVPVHPGLRAPRTGSHGSLAGRPCHPRAKGGRHSSDSRRPGPTETWPRAGAYAQPGTGEGPTPPPTAGRAAERPSTLPETARYLARAALGAAHSLPDHARPRGGGLPNAKSPPDACRRALHWTSPRSRAGRAPRWRQRFMLIVSCSISSLAVTIRVLAL